MGMSTNIHAMIKQMHTNVEDGTHGNLVEWQADYFQYFILYV